MGGANPSLHLQPTTSVCARSEDEERAEVRLKSDFHTLGLVLISPQLGVMGDAVRRVQRQTEVDVRVRTSTGTCSQTDPSANLGSATSGRLLNLSEPYFPPLQVREGCG